MGCSTGCCGYSPAEYHPEAILGIQIPGLGVVVTFLLLLITGVLAANFVGRAFVGGWESLLDRIPFVRSIYSAAKNFAEIVFSDSSNAFKNVLLVEYPRKGIFSLAFQTSSDLGEVQGRTGEEVDRLFRAHDAESDIGIHHHSAEEGRSGARYGS